jgi:RNA polymerase sigma factor (sigma-70 family)
MTIRGSGREPESFAALFDLYFVAIHHYLARRVGPDLADELASETFAVALRERRRFDPARSGARPWLYGIAANLLRHHWRSERRQLLAYAKTGLDPVSDGGLSAVEDRLDALAVGPALAGAMARLELRDREVLLLFVWAELTYAEIAEALAIPVGTVRSRLWRARQQVRELLDPNGKQLEGPTEGRDHG